MQSENIAAISTYSGTVRIRSKHVQKLGHGSLSVEQTFVKITIDDLSTILDLSSGNGKGFLVFSLQNVTTELARTSNVTTLSNVKEIGQLIDAQDFETRKQHAVGVVLSRLRTRGVLTANICDSLICMTYWLASTCSAELIAMTGISTLM
jgi:hypothetical protein